MFDKVDIVFCYERYLIIYSFLQDFSKGKGSNFRLTHVYPKGWLQHPYGFFPVCFKTLKKVIKGIIDNRFYILCGHFDERKWVVPLILMKENGWYHLTRGRVSRQSQRVKGWLQPLFIFLKYLVAILKNICTL